MRRLAALVLAWLLAASAQGAEVTLVEPGEQLKAVLSSLARAEKTVDAAMFLLSDGRVIAALKDAADRGVELRLLLEPSNRSNRRSAAKLEHKRISIRWFAAESGDKEARLHARAACFDAKMLWLGSADWIRSSLGRDEEASLLVEEKQVLGGWAGRFEALWLAASPQLPRRWLLMDELHGLPDPQDYLEDGPRVNSRRGR